MMKRVCNVCGAAEALPFQYFEEREMGAAGSMENRYGQIDLCLKHALAMLSDFDKHMPRGARIGFSLHCTVHARK